MTFLTDVTRFRIMYVCKSSRVVALTAYELYTEKLIPAEVGPFPLACHNCHYGTTKNSKQ